jgi:undecaprenyl-diphosphatase
MLFGLSRKAATEFSFFLAVPTLIAAGIYDSWKNRHLFAVEDGGMWAVGLVVSFISAFLVIRYVATHDFRWFAWYRIAFGIAVLLTAATGAVNWTSL